MEAAGLETNINEPNGQPQEREETKQDRSGIEENDVQTPPLSPTDQEEAAVYQGKTETTIDETNGQQQEGVDHCEAGAFEVSQQPPSTKEQEVQKILKKFTFYCLGQNVSKVTIHYKLNNKKEEKELHRMGDSESPLWTTSVPFMPDVSPHMKYFYKVKSDSWLKKKTECLELGKNPSKWDSFDDASVDCAKAHLFDIILGSEKIENTAILRDKCKEIETLVVRNDEVKNVLSQIDAKFHAAKQPSTESLILFAVALGHLCSQSKIPPEEVKLSSKVSDAVLDALSSYSISCLTESALSYMTGVCFVLIKTSVVAGRCIISMMNICIKFLKLSDALPFLKQFESDLKRVKVCDYSILETLKLMEVIFVISSTGQLEVGNRAIAFLMDKSPFELLCAVYMISQNDDNTMLCQKIRKGVHKRIKSIELLVKSKSCISLVKRAWEAVYEVEKERKQFQPLFQDTVIKFLEMNFKTVEGCENDIMDLITKLKLFQEHEFQRILKVLSQVKDQKINSIFVELLTIAGNTTLYSELGHKCFSQWYFASSKAATGKSKPCLKDICSKLSLLLRLPGFSDREELIESVREIMIKELSKLKLKDIINQVQTVDDISTELPLLGNIVIEVVASKLKTSTEHEHVLASFADVETKRMTLTTRLQAEIVCVVIEKYGLLQEHDTGPEQFFSVVKKRKIWSKIFQVNGLPEFVKIVQSNCLCQKAQQCIHRTFESMRNADVGFRFIKKMECFEIEARETLSLIVDCDDVDKVLSKLSDEYEREEKAIELVINVLQRIEKKNVFLPDHFKSLVINVYQLKDNFECGKVLAKQCQDTWSRLCHVDEMCERLNEVTKSDVFWNVYRNQREKNKLNTENINHKLAFVENDTQRGQTDAQSNDKRVVGDIVHEATETKAEYVIAIEYVQSLDKLGLYEYKKGLCNLAEGTSVSMDYVLHMFGNSANIDKEKTISDHLLGSPLPQSVWVALKQVYSVSDVNTNVQAMKGCLKALDIGLNTDETLSSAFSAFDKLLDESFAECTFEDVKAGMGMIFLLVSKFSNKTTDIMLSLAKSPSLISFLRETIHEDTCSLIDAVEDFSEQFVRESTVSGLIDMKRYLKPILTTNYSGKCCMLFEALEKQTVLFENIANLPGKIVDCADNFHNLKSLYNNVSNRGEHTKEVAKSIIERGKFRFEFKERSNALIVEAFYTQSVYDSTDVNRQKPDHGTRIATKDKATLVDHRSRALLLMNTEREDPINCQISRRELECFVEYIDQCFILSDILLSLHRSGHVGYISINKVIKPSEFENNIADLEKVCSEWHADLKREREQFYLLNFIRGPHLHVLYKYFEKFKELDEPSKLNLTASVETLLFFIHPDMKIRKVREESLETDEIRDFYEGVKRTHLSWNNRIMLHCIGYALAETFNSTVETEEEHKNTLVDDTAGHVRRDTCFKMTDVVQNGIPLVAQLDAGSAYTVKTVIALYALTKKRVLPKPHQILFCARETTTDELVLLIERCLGETNTYCQSLYCIANVEMLSSELQFLLLEILKDIRDRSKSFLLAVVCRGSKNHPVIDELSEFVTTVTPATDAVVKSVFCKWCPDVLALTSDLPGQGKTSFIRQTAHKRKKGVIVLHISGPIRKLQLIKRLRSLRVRKHNLLHIEISDVENPTELDTFLFELLTLKHVSCDRMSACLNTSHVYLEIGNTFNDRLRDNLQTAMLFKRKHITWENFNNFDVSSEVQSPVQVVCQYLNYLENGLLDTEDIMISNSTPLPAWKCKTLLRKHFKNSEDMSYPSVNTAIRVLASQLKKMSCSPFFQINRLQDMIGYNLLQNTKSSLVKVMIESANDFSLRSVSACRKRQMTSVSSNTDKGRLDQVSLLTQRVEGMIRWEDCNHLMFVFHSQNIQTISPIYSDITKVPHRVKVLFETQMKKELQDFKKMSQTELQDILQKIARNDPKSLPSAKLEEMARTYALTPDNLLKMVLIVLRIKAHVPVVVMGETGCGKTSLLQYLANICEMPFDIINIHAGISEEKITEDILKSSMLASSSGERWLFLDEVNTSNSIGLISDIICHHRCLDKQLSPNLVVIGACNPYKLRSEKAIGLAGLTGKLKSDELSKLVYRVHPLPEKLFDYVWDFGSLSANDERRYILRMIADVFDPSGGFHVLFADVLSESQCFVRRKETSTYAVSLRDVNRCKILTLWFLRILRDLKPEPKRPYTFNCQVEIRAIVLALAHCYHSRFSDKNVRREYRNIVRKYFDDKILDNVDKSTDYIKSIIDEEQNDILSRMEVPEGTARNTALTENVFIIFVCIFNKIPVFVVGKPGCSKSLAMQVIRSNIRGKDSPDDFFSKLPMLYCVSYQGSESSTSDGIEKVFQTAKKYQESNNAEDVLSVVILDEIGLAEVSRFNPLKVLHSLLESEKGNSPSVAVVGLSNWALDASKMNRAIYLSRTDMDTEELYETAKSISSSFIEDSVTAETSEQAPFLKAFQQHSSKNILFDVGSLDFTLKRIAEAYNSYMKQLLFKNFHGLRDFYALVKHIARICATKEYSNTYTNQKYLSDIVIDGLERNFAGLPDGTEKLIQIFKDHFDFQNPVRNHILDMIAENVNDPISRHLMMLTNGDSSLGIIEQHLYSTGRTRKEVIFGSQFEDDLSDDYNYRILSKIILCMEEGVVLVLKDLENIYGSLYDMLNQTYTIIGKKKNCRVALGAYSNPFCHVANTFRCIVLMDESKVRTCDPPFLNRFEKHYLRFSDIVDEEQSKMIKELNSWIFDIRTIRDKDFKFTDILPIYSEDLVASLVWKLKSSLIQFQQVSTEDCKRELLMLLNPAAIIRLKSAKSHEMRANAEEMKQAFFRLPLHKGLIAFISDQLKTLPGSDNGNGLLTIIFTNSNVHTKLPKCINALKVQTDKLGIFKSEKQLTQRINNFWFNSEGTDILMIQCSAVDDEKHILLTKAITEQCRANAVAKFKETTKHVYLIIHLDKSKGTSKISSQINFVSEWKLIMLDNLECPKTCLQDLCEMEPLDAVKSKTPLQNCLTEELLWAFTRIKYGPYGRDINSICDILNLMKDTPEFMEVLGDAVLDNVSVMDTEEKDWQLNVACDVQALRNSATFIDALEQRVMSIIKVPLAKLIYSMEMHGILDCFFIQTNSENRRKTWKTVLEDSRYFSIDEIPDDTDQPECYVCNTDDLSLIMPFSRTLFHLIEKQRDDFFEDLAKIKARNGWEPGEDLPQPLYVQLLKQHERLILLNIPDSRQLFYKGWENDYINDFCNILSMPMCPSTDREKRTRYMNLIISLKESLVIDDPCKLLVSLHTTSWVNSTLYRAEMQLFGICEKVLPEKNILSEIMQLRSPIGTEPQSVDEHSETQQSIETETDNYLSSDILDMCPGNMLVQYICENMLPTPDTVDAYGGIEIWQRKVNTVLVLAAKVSNKSKQLHALRVCNDIASSVIISLNLNTEGFEKMGTLLANSSHSLDSEEVFMSVFRIIDEGLKSQEHKGQSVNHIYAVLSSYLVRCIDYNSATKVQECLFKKVLSGELSEDIVPVLKAPLSNLFDIEEDEFLNLIGIKHEKEEVSNECDSLDEETSTSDDETSDSSSGQNFVDQVNSVLLSLKEKQRQDSALVLLFVDILQRLYGNRMGTNATRISEILFKCHNILHERQFGIEYIAAVSFVKAFFSRNIQRNLHNIDEIKHNQMAIILKEGVKRITNMTLTGLFLKTMLSSFTLCQLKQFLDKHADVYGYLQKIPWSKYFECYSYERNPLCLLIDISVHKHYPCCNYDITPTELDDETFVTLPDSTYSGVLAMFSLAARIFYFPKICEPLTDTKRTFATSIVSHCTQTSFKGTYFLKYLVGVSDFRISVFNINENTTHTEYCMTSFFVALYMRLLGRNEFIEEKNRPFLIDCLVNPQAIGKYFLPGFCDYEHKPEETHNPTVSLCGCGYRKAIRSESKFPYNCSSCLAEPKVDHTAVISCSCGYRTVHVTEYLNKSHQCFFCRRQSESKLAVVLSCICDTYTVYDMSGMSEEDKWCLFCMSIAKNAEENVKKPGSSHMGNTSWKMMDYENIGFSVRGLHPVTVHVLQMLIKACILGSLALGFSSIKDIEEITGLTDLDTDGRVIWAEIKKHWQITASHLNMNDNNLSIMLHNVLSQSEKFFSDCLYSFTNSRKRQQLEKNVDELFALQITKASTEVRSTLRKHDNLHGITDGTIETTLAEADDISQLNREQRVSYFLFRVNSYPLTKDNFICEFSLKRKSFPFLNLVLRYERYLKLPKHIFNIIRWHMAILARANYVMKKHDCLEMKVEDFIYYNQEPNHEQIGKRFELFEKSWNELLKLLEFHKISQKMDVIHKQSKMKDCLIYGKESILYEVLKILVHFQNDFLDKALQMASSCNALNFLLRETFVSAIPCVQITEAKIDDLIDFNFNWNTTLSHGMLYRESNCSLQYGDGNKIIYDFCSIEKAAAVLTLAGKSYLMFENSLPNVLFTDELFLNYASLIRELKANIPQQPLTSDIENGIRTRCKDDPRIVKELLAHLGILMTLLKKTGKEEETRSLTEYASEWQDLLTHAFPRHLLPRPESCVKLCHIVPLSELLEEICSESAVDALDKEYRDHLDSNIESHIIQIVRKKHISNMLLKVIKLFSHRCLSTKTVDPKQPLNSYLSDDSFWPEGSRDQNMVTVCNTSDNVFSLLPNFIMVRHVYFVVKDMETEIQNLEREHKQMESIETQYSRTKSKGKHKSKQKRAAALVRDY